MKIDSLAIASSTVGGLATTNSIPPEAHSELGNILVTALMSLVTGVIIPSFRDWWQRHKARKQNEG